MKKDRLIVRVTLKSMINNYITNYNKSNNNSKWMVPLLPMVKAMICHNNQYHN